MLKTEQRYDQPHLIEEPPTVREEPCPPKVPAGKSQSWTPVLTVAHGFLGSRKLVTLQLGASRPKPCVHTTLSPLLSLPNSTNPLIWKQVRKLLPLPQAEEALSQYK